MPVSDKSKVEFMCLRNLSQFLNVLCLNLGLSNVDVYMCWFWFQSKEVKRSREKKLIKKQKLKFRCQRAMRRNLKEDENPRVRHQSTF
jgi:hypothetical protein